METQDPIKVRLLEAAGEEFAAKGYDAAGARSVSVPRPTWRPSTTISGTKSSSTFKRSWTRIAAAPGGEEVDPSLPPAAQLRCFIHHFLAHVLAIHDPEDWRHRLMLREMLHPTVASDVLIREAIRPKFERLARILPPNAVARRPMIGS